MYTSDSEMKPSIHTENQSKVKVDLSWRCSCTNDEDSDLYCYSNEDYCMTNTSVSVINRFIYILGVFLNHSVVFR